jgi:ZIP family zinc transporter
VIGVAFFDLAPEALEAGRNIYQPRVLLSIMAIGFFFYPVLDRMFGRHDCQASPNPARGFLGAASFSAHSVVDGFAMGIAYQADRDIGLIVAAAVLAHDFADASMS